MQRPVFREQQMASAPVSAARFECSDCGRERPGYMRNQCRVCGEYICDVCDNRHPDQHPIEAWRT